MNPRKRRRAEESLRRELSSIILYELKDPRTRNVTVTGVELAEDARSAKVLVTIRGDEGDTENTLRALHHARGFMQALIGKRLPLRYTPVLSFAVDKEVLRILRVQKLIEQARQEDQKVEP